ncbi:MAG: OmpA family protein [Candidatus Binatus sp.]|jgi:outer membrane protein OmpA-like peptidoglycan-associated protein|uniref:OmpA family protein n=1 Tax=Candidatus Binatus sp. TaxID=2811406 RepID=UPI003C7163DF
MRRISLVLALLLLASCSSRQSLFVVLPNPDGSSGAVTIEDGQKSVVLDQPYAAGEVRGGAAAPVKIDQAQVQQIFGNALAAQPILPSHFVLYFERDSDTLTPESQRQYQGVFEDIKRRNVYEVEVIGHTDTMGTQAHNQRLSMSRAEMIRDRLVHDGISPKSISVAGRGSLDLAVRTADQVAEPRNRRVEITVR